MTFFSLRATFLDFQNIKIDEKNSKTSKTKNWNKTWNKVKVDKSSTFLKKSWFPPCVPLVSWWFLNPRTRPWDRSWCAKSPPQCFFGVMSTKEELRNLALSYVSEVFRQKLDSVADSSAAKDQAPGDEDINEDVKVKFEQTFANYLRYAYDFRLFFGRFSGTQGS